MITAKHLPGSMPLARARAEPARCRSAMASVCGTVKLTVAAVVMPSAAHSSSTSRPAAVAGSLTAIFGAQAWKRFAIAEHALAVAGAHRVDLRADEAGLAPRAFVLGAESRGAAQDRDLHEGFGLLLGGQIARENGVDVGGPKLAIGAEGDVREKRIRSGADGAAFEAQVEFGRGGRVVPPPGPGVLQDPIQVRRIHEKISPPLSIRGLALRIAQRKKSIDPEGARRESLGRLAARALFIAAQAERRMGRRNRPRGNVWITGTTTAQTTPAALDTSRGNPDSVYVVRRCGSRNAKDRLTRREPPRLTRSDWQHVRSS